MSVLTIVAIVFALLAALLVAVAIATFRKRRILGGLSVPCSWACCASPWPGWPAPWRSGCKGIGR
jgi:hypothetical protein